MTKDDSLLESLIAGDEEAIDQFGECENCVVTDWKDGADDILGAVALFLPDDYWKIEKLSDSEWRIQVAGRDPQILPFVLYKQEDFFVALNRVLAPDYELRQFTPCDGDGYSLFLRPVGWWRDFDAKHPDIAQKYFLTTERLAAFLKKSFFRRLFSKR
jgi:hypothetical protein